MKKDETDVIACASETLTAVGNIIANDKKMSDRTRNKLNSFIDLLMKVILCDERIRFVKDGNKRTVKFREAALIYVIAPELKLIRVTIFGGYTNVS